MVIFLFLSFHKSLIWIRGRVNLECLLTFGGGGPDIRHVEG